MSDPAVVPGTKIGPGEAGVITTLVAIGAAAFGEEDDPALATNVGDGDGVALWDADGAGAVELLGGELVEGEGGGATDPAPAGPGVPSDRPPLAGGDADPNATTEAKVSVGISSTGTPPMQPASATLATDATSRTRQAWFGRAISEPSPSSVGPYCP